SLKPIPVTQKHPKNMYASKSINTQEITKRFSKMFIIDPVDGEISDNTKIHISKSIDFVDINDDYELFLKCFKINK
ncbi:2685_t:CDS:1, partial [Racocetra persica]